jgi:hypothetical protein
MSEKVPPKLFLELGQMLKIIAPDNSSIHNKNFYVEYLDNTLIKLINDKEDQKIELGISNGSLRDETIESVIILYSPDVKGYALQNDLVPEKWISIEIGGDVPTIINGQITDLDGDEIELNIYQTESKIYINFNYKGIPLDLPIVNISTFIPPELSVLKEGDTPSPLEEDMDFDDGEDLELIIDSETINRNTHNLFISIDDIEVGDEALGEITTMKRVKESEKRFGIESQTQDILDVLLSEYPSDRRTKRVLNNIHITIERYKQLRRHFSNFNETGNAESIRWKGADYKPLIKNLEELNKKLYWLIPVARNSHKLFCSDHSELCPWNDGDEYEDTKLIKIRHDQSDIMEAFTQYKSNKVPSGQNKYEYLIQKINPYLTPFTESSTDLNIITKTKVNENMDILINNIGNFDSNMIDKKNISTRQFVIDKYNLGISTLKNPDIKNKHSKTVVTPLTQNDSVGLLGFLRLQEPYINYSHINLPTTSIYDKSNLHFFNYFYFNILKNWARGEDKIIKEGQDATINDTDIYMSVSDDDKKKKKKLFGFNTYYSFEELRDFEDRDKSVYSNFLNNIIPKTRVLFELVKKYIKNGTSYVKVIEYLEPFMIYDEDISYKQYETIVQFIYDEIQKHKQTLFKNNEEFIKYIKGIKSYSSPTILPKLVRSVHHNIFEKTGYNINDSIGTELSLKKMIDFDSGRLYNTSLALSGMTTGVIDVEQRVIEELKEEQPKEGSKDCAKIYTLVKKYIDLDELKQDDNSIIFVDKKYDETPYDIGENWKNKNGGLMDSIGEEEKIIKLTDFLIENNGIDRSKAVRDAEAMIYGSRAVIDGEYAYLDIGQDVKYYVRQDHTWRYDKSLSGQRPEEINFCNVKDNCFKINEKCVNLDSSKDMIKNNILEDIVKRFEDDMVLSMKEFKVKLLQELDYRTTNLTALKQLKIKQFIKNDLMHQKIASTLEERDIIISPYETLRDEILSQNNMVTKYANLETFVYQYCRYANDNEDSNWYYCVDVDVKLLPTFYVELGRGFSENNYISALEKVKKERGEKSDDGDKWVDKFSGYYITNDITLDYSEGYNADGYKNVSRDVIEDETSDKLNMERFKSTEQDKSTKLSKKIERILLTLDEKLYISTKLQHNEIIKIVSESINTNGPGDKKEYNLTLAKIEKNNPGKVGLTYQKRYDQVLIYSLISAYIISIQSAIEPIITKRVGGDCKKSFTGFPLDGNTDVTFIEYLSCIIFSLRSAESPYNILPKALKGKLKKRRDNYAAIMDKFVVKIKTFMTENILTMVSVQQKLRFKREWNKNNKTIELIPDEFNIQRWASFLPPLRPVTVRQLNNISVNFEKTLRARIKEGSYEQFHHLWALYGKIVSYSFSIIESVQRAVNNAPLLLETKSGIPFLENACCNEGEPNTNLYFSNKESSIQKHNKIIKSLTTLYYKYKNINKGPYFNIKEDTKLIYPRVSGEFSKETVYLSFLKYCEFNTGIQLDEGLKRVCINNICKFNFTDTIKDKILTMEANDLVYSASELNVLLNIINKRNILNYDLDPSITTEKLQLEGVILYLKGKDSNICHSEMLGWFEKIVDRFDVSIKGKDDDTVLGFTSYLDAINAEMSGDITKKLLKHKQLSTKLQDMFTEYIPFGEVSTDVVKTKRNKFLLNWDLIGDNIYMSQDDETGFSIFRMIKSMVINICKVYPNIISNEVNFDERYIPKHWLKGSQKFSLRHKKDLMNTMLKDGKGFSQFYKNKNIDAVLNSVLQDNEDLLLLLNAIPFYSGVLDGNKKTGSIFDGKILKKLGYYFLLCSFSIYISASNKDLPIDTTDMDDGDQDSITNDTCSLLSVYLERLFEYKKLLNVSAATINKNVLLAKTKEKEKMVKSLGNLTVEEREIEDLMKNCSLGKWGVGRTSKIYKYDENQYDKEREALEKDALMELRSGGLDDVSDFHGELLNMSNVLDQYQNEEVAARISKEVNNLEGLGDDDDYGDRDGDTQGDYN